MLRFCRSLIHFRKTQPTVRRTIFLTGQTTSTDELPDVSWFAPDGQPADWNHGNHGLVCLLGTAGLDDPAARPVLMMFNSSGQPRTFTPPGPALRFTWRLFVDTAAQAPGDIYPEIDGPALPSNRQIPLAGHSVVCYVGHERIVAETAAAKQSARSRKADRRPTSRGK
jgi:glycogen operon protein